MLNWVMFIYSLNKDNDIMTSLENEHYTIEPIGIVHSPYKTRDDVPCCQKDRLDGIGLIELFPSFQQGLDSIDGFSHIIVLFRFHLTDESPMMVIPYLDTIKRGVFATRSPARPNHIGLDIVELVKREKNVLTIKGLDMVDGTPIIDIKPYVYYDQRRDVKVGWLEGKAEKE